MSSSKLKKDKKLKPKFEKKLVKLINDSDSGSENEHELSYYLNDRVKLMKEVIHILKPKKIKSMAPNCIKHLNIEEINSMLLEELLGISNKRLKKIFNGEPQDDDSSSTDEEEEKAADVISLDDITDDEFVIDLDSDNEKSNSRKKKKGKVKPEPKDKTVKVKKERNEKKKGNKNEDGTVNPASEEHLMSVLELLELQARARAIRSQLALENSRKEKEKQKEEVKEKCAGNSDVEDAIIIESPKNEEIIITSSDSEIEPVEVTRKEAHKSSSYQKNNENVDEKNTHTKTKETINKNAMDSINDSTSNQSKINKAELSIENPEEINKLLNKMHKMKRQKRKLDHKTSKSDSQVTEKKNCVQKITKTPAINVSNEPVFTKSDVSSAKLIEDQISLDGEDGIILNVDQAEMDSINLESENLILAESANKISQPPVENDLKDLDETANDISCQNTCENHPYTNSMNFDSNVSENPSQKNVIISDDSQKDINDDKEQTNEDADGIILNVDQSELESINLDST